VGVIAFFGFAITRAGLGKVIARQRKNEVWIQRRLAD
jgi:hypothetical protein